MTDTALLRATPITANFGAVVDGFDVAAGLRPEESATLHDLVVEHGVVVLPDQRIDDEAQLALARSWGELDVYPLFRCAGQDVPLEWVEDTESSPPKAIRWHTDISWEPLPPKFGMLAGKVAPDIGGDTIWADTAGAYDALTPTMQTFLTGLEVVHRVEPGAMDRLTKLVDPDAAQRFRDLYAEGLAQPLVRRNGDNGRLCLFLGGYWMHRIVGMHADESDALLGFLMAHATHPFFQCRWHWREHDLVIWDERRTMHLAMPDHYPRHRKLRRCTVVGEAPIPG